ncbi:glycosyltransferase [Candidatus Gottesmanbacteria bacterium]|nr:glycosyltransferase [Candidatus Gottesmanbacteria bacterium]
MKLQKLIDRFNEPETHLMVSAWPEKESNHGIAWYTKLVTTAQARRHGVRFVVLAERGADNRPRLYERGRILVLRVFDNTHHSLYPTILTWLGIFSRVRSVMVHSEFGVNAGLVHYLLLIPFLALIRLAGRQVTYFAHNVITDVSFLRDHLNVGDNPYKTDLLNLAVKLHTNILTKLAHRVAVLDDVLKRRLARMIPGLDVVTLTIPVEPKRTAVSKREARRRLGLPVAKPVIMAFGFLSPYKGTDWLVSAFNAWTNRRKTASPMTLVLAGGPAHSLADRPYYKKWYEQLLTMVDHNPTIRLTGFVPEKDIPMYFAAADLVVLPYRGIMGASGVLTHILSYRKPFMVSTAMKEAIKSKKFPVNRMIFDVDAAGIAKIYRTLQSNKHMRSLTAIARAIEKKRAVEQESDREYTLLYSSTHEIARIQPRFRLAWAH